MLFLYRYLCFILISAHASNAFLTNEYKTYKDYKVYEITGDRNGVEKLLKYIIKNYDIPIYDHLGSKAHVLLPPNTAQTFEEIADIAQLSTKLVVDDYSKIILSEKISPRDKQFSWTAYYDVDDIYSFLRNISKDHSNSTELIVGGESYEGRQILGLRINTPKDREDKPVMFIESAMRDQFDWRIFPTVNPDGYHYTHTTDRCWRKTRSKSTWRCYGADPNRNWDYNWGNHGSSNDPCNYETYAGAEPFSEKETRTLSKYISSIENLTGYIAFHSTAQMLLLPYSDSTGHFDNYDDLVQIGKTSLEYGRAVNGVTYKGPGTAAEILYEVSGGSMDWVRHALGPPLVFTYELRGVNFHWPPERIPEQGDEVTQMMLGLVTEAKKLGYY